MPDIRSQKQIEEMRTRLYARTAPTTDRLHSTLSDTLIPVADNWQTPQNTKPKVQDVRNAIPTMMTSEVPLTELDRLEAAPRRSYRMVILAITFVLFITMAGVSATYLYFGANQISANNIGVSLSVPGTIGGGEVLPLQFGITNQNSVPIESVVLIVNYPPGTQSADETPRRLNEERITIDPLAPGEVRNIPQRVVLFGEENQEQTITASLEYRIANSNGLFYKELAPSVVRINSSPIILTASAIERVASGQQVTITVTARSNASNPLTNILIQGEFPPGFTVTESSRTPVSGQNVWRIETIPPEGEVVFTVTGRVEGLTDASMRTRFVSGLSQPDDQLALASTLAAANADFLIERPFIKVEPLTDGQTGTSAILPPGKTANIEVLIQNTLTETVYDLRVEARANGNVISSNSFQGGSGFYDSNTESIRWDVANNSQFAELKPGDIRRVSFSLSPNEVRAQAAFTYDIAVYARRVVENQSIEQLLGEAVGGARYSTAASFGSQVERNGLFTDTGPIPPQVGEVTTYTATMVVTAEENGIENARVTTSLPSQVTWLDQVRGDGRIVFNTVSKQLEWVVGNVAPNGRAQVSFQVSILPSTSQVGRSVELVRDQTLQAQDAYTKVQLRNSAPALGTELSSEAGFPRGNGTVVRGDN